MLALQEERLPIFVYGTVMTGERNHIQVLEKNLIRSEKARTTGKLYYYSKEEYPALVDGRETISGQLLYVENLQEVLEPLDKIEGYLAPHHPQNMYDRRIIEVTTATGAVKKAYAYLINPSLFKKERAEFSLIESNSWRKFNQRKC